jgi:hypothetical protein
MHEWPQQPVPVFPLAGAVLFPRAVLPLHIFELRYRTMVRDALSRDRAIAMATLKPGWERDYAGTPAFFPVGCVGRIERVEWLPNDCYDLALEGVVRVRFTRVVKDYPYRAAAVESLPQHPLAEDDPIVALERRALREAWSRYALARLGPTAVPGAMIPDDATLEEAANRLCASLDIDPAGKLALLEMDSVIDRSQRVRAWIERRLSERRGPESPAAPPGDLN